MLQIKQQPAVQPPKNTIFTFQTDDFLREYLHLFDTKNN